MTTEQLKLSNSSIKTLLRCEQKYDYKYIQFLVAKRAALPLHLGSWLHLLLEARYRGGEWQTQWYKLARTYDKLFAEEKDYYGDLPRQTKLIMQGYDYHWRGDEKDWSIVETERRMEVPLGKNWLYVGKADVVAENEDGLWIWDHKSFKGKAPNSDYRTSDPQSALYDWAYEKVTGVKPVGFVFNYVRTKLPTMPKMLVRGGISKAKSIDTNWLTLARFLKKHDLNPSEYREQLAAARARDSLFYDRVFIPKPTQVIRNLLLDIQEKAGRIRALHEGARPARTLTMNCRHDCEYHLLCLTELTGGDGSYIKKHDFKVEAWTEYDEPTVIEEA